jgi:hypothetical protein
VGVARDLQGLQGRGRQARANPAVGPNTSTHVTSPPAALPMKMLPLTVAGGVSHMPSAVKTRDRGAEVHGRRVAEGGRRRLPGELQEPGVVLEEMVERTVVPFDVARR